MIAKNSQLADVGSAANRRRASRAGQRHAALAELGQTFTPPMTKHAFAALLRRALRGGGVGFDDAEPQPGSRGTGGGRRVDPR